MDQAVAEGVSECLNETKAKGGQCKEQKQAHDILKYAILKTVAKRYRIKRHLLSNMHLNKNAKHEKSRDTWWEAKPRKKRKDCLKDFVKQDVAMFFMSEEISREVPNKREVVTIKGDDKKERVSKHVMIMTMKDAFELFKRKHKDVKIGFTSFCKLKPKQVRKVSETNKRSCLCQICCNAALKEEAMKTLINSTDEMKQVSKGLKVLKKDVSAMTLCSFGNENNTPRSECLNRKCKNCGVHAISEHYKEVAKICREQQKEINWYNWEYVDVSKGEAKKRIMSCVSKSTSVDHFLTEYENTMSVYSSHIFRANWQHEQMNVCQENLKEGQVMMVMDFSENYKCGFQNEPSSAYFEQNMVTIHPIMCYMRENVQNENLLIKHAIICITDDLKHDGMAVSAFENKALTILGSSSEVNEVIQWTDGCAAQYKSKNCFALLSSRQIKTSRNFFETSHGKSVCDGLGAIVKNSCYRAMLSKKVLAGAEDVYKHCTETLVITSDGNKKTPGTLSRRQFVFVNSTEINRTESYTATTFSGTRKIHCVRNTDQAFSIEYRNLSCYCSECRIGTQMCENVEHVDKWTMTALKVVGQTEETVPRILAAVDLFTNCHYADNRTSSLLEMFLLGFWSGNFFLIAPFPDHRLLSIKIF